jgi:hypothetical protein
VREGRGKKDSLLGTWHLLGSIDLVER